MVSELWHLYSICFIIHAIYARVGYDHNRCLSILYNMSFASIHFLFLFVPITFLLYFLLSKGNWRYGVLVVSSLIFFAWVDFASLHFLLLFVIVNYLVGLVLGFFHTYEKVKITRVTMWSGVALNLLFLGFFKYSGFFTQIVRGLSGMGPSIVSPGLFLGLSYLTFSSLSYILDVYHQVREPERNLLKFSAYLVMFPKLVQGPIALYRDLGPQLTSKRLNPADLNYGVRRFIIGLAKKVILADSLAIAANRVFAADAQRLGAGVAWFGLLAYTLVIYFDFAGYTDMALGIGRVLGFRLPENFNAPYLSRSITDFWRRWHISLTAWFRTYVFIPLEFKRRRVKFLRQQSHILIVFLLTGLWHGASWNYVIWGGYYGLILALEASGFGKALKRAPVVLQHLYTLLIVMVGWVFFRITRLQNWGPFFGALFGANGFTHLETLRTLNILFYLPLLLVGIVACLPLGSILETRWIADLKIKNVLADLLVFGVFLLSLSYMLTNGFQVFMYAQF
jgi:alginate O-acetyltransferase complex protein AlgI